MMSTVNIQLKKNSIEQQTEVPDSTTSVEREMSDFSIGQDVLVKQKDDRYYFGTVVQVNSVREQCLVKFGDNTYNWSTYKDLTKLSTPEQEDLLCVVCKQSAPKDKQEITVCDQCGRGYHQKCHQPDTSITSQKDNGSTWVCKRCVDSDSLRLKKSDLKHQRRDSLRNSSTSSTHEVQSLPTSTVKVLPYDLNSLNWDTYHRVNSEQIYCYCGSNGEWYKQMLQCGRCRQWFHERCLECLQYPLYCGDRFYVFLCSICNQGKDFVRRLEMKWVDLVHLMLFNLTAFNSKKYYDLDTVVVPYINDNWHALQLPPKISNVSKLERRENIMSVLTNNRNRFKCGREIKKRTTIWGLRVRLPPPAPCIVLPLTGLITEEELRESWQGNRRLQFLPIDKNTGNKRIVETDANLKNMMMGVTYQQNSAHSESDSPCPSPEILSEDLAVVQNDKILQKNSYLGAGCAKKSVPFKKMSLQRRKKLLAMSSRERERILKRPKRRNTMDDGVIKSEREGFTKLRLSVDSRMMKNTESLPSTPPISSAPPTPPASNTTSIISDLSNDFSESSTSQTKVSSPKKTSILELNSEFNTPCDTSGDETSSKSTLDAIIPPPKDFEGKNNPFLVLLRGSAEEGNQKGRKRKDITLPLPLTAVIPGAPKMRPTKRQLSEKDIVIGPNGQVKRKRFRRGRNPNVNYGQTASKTAAVVPVRTDSREWGQRTSQSPNSSNLGNCVDYPFTGRRLRQRPEKPQEREKISSPPTPKPSPVKQEPDIDMDDLKSSVNIYFGAANRIATGEKFVVKAKRIGPTGKTDYLIEWEGPSTGMT